MKVHSIEAHSLSTLSPWVTVHFYQRSCNFWNHSRKLFLANPRMASCDAAFTSSDDTKRRSVNVFSLMETDKSHTELCLMNWVDAETL
ncbi:hypothetical protein TNCV_1477061 [Trichonephila clavipes]|nr:hypothetical protein TNCV_1477061 [Trichonephila clavipes]